MSSYSFSHQFYQRWTCAPDSIRAAIIQELTDITTLLQHDTPFESFVFSNHDLDAHLEDLYENYDAEQAIAKAIADKQVQEQAAADEKQRLEEEQKQQAMEDAKLKEENKRRQQAEVAEKEQQKNEQLAANQDNVNHSTATDADVKINANSSITDGSERSATENFVVDNKVIEDSSIKSASAHERNDSAITTTDNNIKTVIDKAVSDAAMHLSLKNTQLGVTHPELIRELEMHVDDYLSEQMMQISENLKSWLRAELTQHLTEPDKTITNNHNESGLKKNIH